MYCWSELLKSWCVAVQDSIPRGVIEVPCEWSTTLYATCTAAVFGSLSPWPCTLQVNRCLSIKGAEDVINKPFAFEISTTENSMYFVADKDKVCVHRTYLWHANKMQKSMRRTLHCFGIMQSCTWAVSLYRCSPPPLQLFKCAPGSVGKVARWTCSQNMCYTLCWISVASCRLSMSALTILLEL